MNFRSVANISEVLSSRIRVARSKVIATLEQSTARHIHLGESMLSRETQFSVLHCDSAQSFKDYGLRNASCSYMGEAGRDTRRLLSVGKIAALIDSEGDYTLQAMDSAQVSSAASRTQFQHTSPRKPAAVNRLIPSHLINQSFQNCCHASQQVGGLV